MKGWVQHFQYTGGHEVPVGGEGDVVIHVHEGNGDHEDENDDDDSFDGVVG